MIEKIKWLVFRIKYNKQQDKIQQNNIDILIGNRKWIK